MKVLFLFKKPPSVGYSIVPDSFPGRHYLYQVWSLLPDIKVRVYISSTDNDSASAFVDALPYWGVACHFPDSLLKYGIRDKIPNVSRLTK